MPVATRSEAIDQMLTLFKTYWDTTGFVVQYANVSQALAPPSTNSPWARVTIQHAISQQATLSNQAGERRWRRIGTITVQVFTPAGAGIIGWSSDLAEGVQQAFEGETTSGGILFRDVTVTEVGAETQFMQTNVVIGFEYDTVR